MQLKQHQFTFIVEVVQKYVKMAKDFGVEKVVGMTSEGEGIVNEILDAIIPDTGPDLLVCGADEDGEHHPTRPLSKPPNRLRE